MRRRDAETAAGAGGTLEPSMAAAEPLLHWTPPGPVQTEFRVGLCAWQDKSMLETGSFYPQKTMSPEERLWWYAQHFDCVEVNSTFYAPLAARNAMLWAERTPPGFLMSVKAYALLTGHHLDAGRLPEPLAETLPRSARPNARGQIENRHFPPEGRRWAFETFREALRPLADAGKLGYVLFQMAPWFTYGRAELDYLATLPEALPGLTVAVEFRDRSWLPGHTDEVLPFLGRHRLTYVSVDSPRVAATVASVIALTGPTAILRLHGRNARGFLKQLRGEAPSVAEKYGYLYDRDELGGLVGRVRRLEGRARRVYLKLNNNVGDAPAINGAELKELLGEAVPERDEVMARWRAYRAARRRPRPSPAC
ncbi:MAG: DUF72 domain-containing protein [Candidatus Rokubacteria bacterium]|nr:DUF72 domain-containing protein [Candidatus Rokubacteria bacterium]